MEAVESSKGRFPLLGQGESHYSYLLASLVIVLIAAPFLGGVLAMRWLLTAVTAFTLAGALSACWHERRLFIGVVVLGILATSSDFLVGAAEKEVVSALPVA